MSRRQMQMSVPVAKGLPSPRLRSRGLSVRSGSRAPAFPARGLSAKRYLYSRGRGCFKHLGANNKVCFNTSVRGALYPKDSR